MSPVLPPTLKGKGPKKIIVNVEELKDLVLGLDSLMAKAMCLLPPGELASLGSTPRFLALPAGKRLKLSDTSPNLMGLMTQRGTASDPITLDFDDEKKEEEMDHASDEWLIDAVLGKHARAPASPERKP